MNKSERNSLAVVQLGGMLIARGTMVVDGGKTDSTIVEERDFATLKGSGRTSSHMVSSLPPPDCSAPTASSPSLGMSASGSRQDSGMSSANQSRLGKRKGRWAHETLAIRYLRNFHIVVSVAPFSPATMTSVIFFKKLERFFVWKNVSLSSAVIDENDKAIKDAVLRTRRRFKVSFRDY